MLKQPLLTEVLVVINTVDTYKIIMSLITFIFTHRIIYNTYLNVYTANQEELV